MVSHWEKERQTYNWAGECEFEQTDIESTFRLQVHITPGDFFPSFGMTQNCISIEEEVISIEEKKFRQTNVCG